MPRPRFYGAGDRGGEARRGEAGGPVKRARRRVSRKLARVSDREEGGEHVNVVFDGEGVIGCRNSAPNCDELAAIGVEHVTAIVSRSHCPLQLAMSRSGDSRSLFSGRDSSAAQPFGSAAVIASV